MDENDKPIKYTLRELEQIVEELYKWYQQHLWVHLGNGDSTQQTRNSFDKRTLKIIMYVEELQKQLAESEKAKKKGWNSVMNWRNFLQALYLVLASAVAVKLFFFG